MNSKNIILLGELPSLSDDLFTIKPLRDLFSDQLSLLFLFRSYFKNGVFNDKTVLVVDATHHSTDDIISFLKHFVPSGKASFQNSWNALTKHITVLLPEGLSSPLFNRVGLNFCYSNEELADYLAVQNVLKH